MFIRTERSIKEFFELYPVVSIIVIIHFVLWASFSLFRLPIGATIFDLGIGHNFSVFHGEYWRLLTPVFLHIQLGHLIFNSFALVIFGPALERMLGIPKFIFVYLFTGIAGNLGTYIIDPTSSVPHLGASGAIYGLFGLYIYMVWMRKDLMDKGSANIVTVVFVIGLVMTFIQPNINIAAHIFGFIAGFATGPIILKNAVPLFIARVRVKRRDDDDIGFDPNRWKKKRRRPSALRKNIFWIILIVLVVFGLIGKYF